MNRQKIILWDAGTIGRAFYNLLKELEIPVSADAAKFFVNLGGFCENTVTQKTNFLIVGDFSYSSNIKDRKSSKLKKAEQLILKGQDLKLLSESVFYEMIKNE